MASASRRYINRRVRPSSLTRCSWHRAASAECSASHLAAGAGAESLSRFEPSWSHTKAHSWHTQSELDTFSAPAAAITALALPASPRVLQCNTWLPLRCESPTSWTRRWNGKAVPRASPRAILLGKPCAGSWQCQSFSACARSWYDGLRPKRYTQTTMCFASLTGREGCSRFLGPDHRLDQPGRRVCRTPRGRADAS